jgi:hypothetical protein
LLKEGKSLQRGFTAFKADFFQEIIVSIV